MGKDYEHTIANEVESATDESVRAYRCGYSGNSKHPQPDVLITTQSVNYAIEAKGKVSSDSIYVEGEDLEQLTECGNEYTSVALVVTFTHREPLVVRYFNKLTGSQMSVDGADAYNDMDTAEKFCALVPTAFDPNVTRSGNLRLRRPSTDDWPSATSGSDTADAVLSGLGIPYEKSVVVE